MFESLTSLFRKENLIQLALDECHQMLELDWNMFQASVESLRRSDSNEIALDIRDSDKRVNKYERDVRRKVITHLSVTGDDISAGLVVVSVVVDIERIGDYTKNIYELAQKHQAKLQGGSLEERLSSVEGRTGELFQRTAKAFKDGDEEEARKVMSEYKEELSSDCESILTDIVSGKVTDLAPGEAAAVALYTRYLKRIASHLRTIMTSVVNPFPRIGYKEKKL
jgi:phosphate transport system protein